MKPGTTPDPWSIDSAFSRLLGLRLVELGEGTVKFSCLIEPHHLNIIGMVHGGVLLTLLDVAGGGAGRKCGDEMMSSVTVNLSSEFCASVQSGVLVATGRVMSRSRGFFFSRSEVVDSDGKILALGSSSHKLVRPPGAVEQLK